MDDQEQRDQDQEETLVQDRVNVDNREQVEEHREQVEGHREQVVEEQRE